MVNVDQHLVGGFNPSEKYEVVKWDDDIPKIWKNKSHVPNHQSVYQPSLTIINYHLPLSIVIIQPLLTTIDSIVNPLSGQSVSSGESAAAEALQSEKASKTGLTVVPPTCSTWKTKNISSLWPKKFRSQDVISVGRGKQIKFYLDRTDSCETCTKRRPNELSFHRKHR